MRVKGGYTNRRRHKKVLKRAKGFYAANSRCYTHAVEKVDRALAYSYRDRRTKKRDFRSLWNQRINAAARLNGMTYSQLVGGLTQAGVQLDRKILAQLAVTEPQVFSELCKRALPKVAHG